MKIQLTQQIIVSERDHMYSALDELCHLSKNLYNATLYLIRQQYKKDKTYLNYYQINKIMHDTKNIDYNALPYKQTSQQILRQVDSIYSSFFKSLKSNKMKGKRVHVPSYKDKEKGRNIVVYTNQCFKLTPQGIKLKTKKDNYLYIKTNKSDVQQVRIVPKGNHIIIEIVYNKEYELKEDNGRYASIDLGVNNICTLTSNVGQAQIWNGRHIKSVNSYYNKKKAKLQSQLQGNKHTSSRIKRLSHKRNIKMKDMMHKLSYQIVERMKANSYNTLFIGKNRGWKDGVHLSKINNQNFVSIPYNTLIQMLTYKCNLAGIKVVVVNESYTSKCSFLDQEKICKHKIYQGKRKTRGLFITASGIKINADVNGSLNILVIGLIKLNVKLDVLDFILRPENKRFVLNPIFNQIRLK